MLFGSSVRATNSFGTAFSLLAVGLLVLLWRRVHREKAWLALLFLGCSYPLVQCGRLCLFENVMVVCMVLSLLFLQGALERTGLFLLAGVFAFLAYVTKAIGAYFVVAAAVAVAFHCLQPNRGKWISLKRWMPCLLFAGGAACVMVLWIFLFRLPNQEAIDHFGAKWMSLNMPNSLYEALLGVGKTPAFFIYGVADKMWIFSVGVVVWVLYDALRKPESLAPSTLAVALWFAGGTVAVSMLRTGPTRYFYPMMYPMMYLCAYGIYRLLTVAQIQWPKRPAWADVAVVCALVIIIRFYVTYQVSVEPLMPSTWPRVWSKLAVSAGLAVVCWTALRFVTIKWSGKSYRVSPVWRWVFVCIVLAYFARNQFVRTRDWYSTRTHSIYWVSQQLSEIEPMVVGGTVACAVVAENDGRAIRIGKPGWCNYERPFERFGLTHLFISKYASEEPRYFKLYPDAMARARPVRDFDVCGYLFTLYEVLPDKRSPAPGSVE
ncbi:MAG: hypothetical protein HN341_06720 [Verrucomicrobia bacterium]|nr:hypothetical protein [Verrucomicrobiota bacterium]